MFRTVCLSGTLHVFPAALFNDALRLLVMDLCCDVVRSNPVMESKVDHERGSRKRERLRLERIEDASDCPHPVFLNEHLRTQQYRLADRWRFCSHSSARLASVRVRSPAVELVATARISDIPTLSSGHTAEHSTIALVYCNGRPYHMLPQLVTISVQNEHGLGRSAAVSRSASVDLYEGLKPGDVPVHTVSEALRTSRLRRDDPLVGNRTAISYQNRGSGLPPNHRYRRPNRRSTIVQ